MALTPIASFAVEEKPSLSVTSANAPQSMGEVKAQLSNDYAIKDAGQSALSIVHTEMPNGTYRLHAVNATAGKGKTVNESWAWQ
ncbi:MAG: hypothetical protein JXK16_06300 [Thiotrichales bacterium]|nr:hypothetical protein [Thiotrichales bacterium]